MGGANLISRCGRWEGLELATICLLEVEVVVEVGEGEEEGEEVEDIIKTRALQSMSLVIVICALYFLNLLHAEVGTYLHPCENDLVCKSSIARIPYFNAPIYLENKSQVGKIDEIFGPFNEFVSSTVGEWLIILIAHNYNCTQ